MAKKIAKKDILPVDETIVDEPVPTPEVEEAPPVEEVPPVEEEVPPVEEVLPAEEEVPPVEEEAPLVEEEAGVVTPDGKGVLPHTVLKAERGARAEAEAKAVELEQTLQQVIQQARDLQDQLQEAQAKIESMPAYEEGGEVAVDEEELPELGELEDHPEEEHSMLAETFGMPSIAASVRLIPAILKHLKAQNALLCQLVEIDNERYTAEQEEHAKLEKAEADEHRSSIEEALDNLPLARHYQAEKPEAWADFISFHDDKINKHPEHSKLPHGERFRKALDMAKAIHGDELGLEKGGVLGCEKGGKVPDAPQHVDELKDEPVAPEGEVAEREEEAKGAVDAEELPLKTDTAEIKETAEKPVSEWTEAELRAKAYETKPKVVAVKKTVTTLGALPGGEAVNLAEKGPAAKRLPASEINKRLAEAAKKGDKEMERVQRELLAG